MACSTDTQPLRSLKELWEWERSKANGRLVGKPLSNYTQRAQVAQTLLCHDMKGGYLPEESVNGCQITHSSKPYIVLHWWYMDVFVYFSHQFVTIPPVGWIDQAHAHGVIVLGTIITEWESGAKICSEVLSSEENVDKTVANLVEIATYHNFEGWLINIENEIEASKTDMLARFLTRLTEGLRSAIGEQSRVIWYDAVTVEGKLKWQNSLNQLNERWFSCTDGIFLNYTWNPTELLKSSERAGGRRHDVYVGVDCFGRGCYGGGGWNCCDAFSHVRNNDLSVALFAPGWVAETMPPCDIIVNSLRRWFSCTDGIFLNYTWNPTELLKSSERAGGRRHDVYVGVDCFGRGCYGGGGWNCCDAFSHVRNNDLSVALFAPGWVAETMPPCDIIVNSLRFWDRLNTLVYAHPVTSLPIETDFSLGFEGEQENCKRYSLSYAALQPHYLASGAFPRTTGRSLVFPGPAVYKLFETNLVLEGRVTICVDADVPLELMLWKEGCERDLPTAIEKKEIGVPNVWNVEFQNERICAVGFSANRVVIVRSFSMKQTPVVVNENLGQPA
ncbi:Cytosolic endo-beta-N-acetylglucosaminidase [Toxocara canis]|uniref:Cytosolic endo-beta-N-acetylglucosaminidase n=1 Tax=Toxocara canis TaxID=6265 RepID=A0A0B2V7Z0_TOXCA|nr:Cytosolic endo-beta-N-acetylglucosaminidase [Toxocara canis]